MPDMWRRLQSGVVAAWCTRRVVMINGFHKGITFPPALFIKSSGHAAPLLRHRYTVVPLGAPLFGETKLSGTRTLNET